MTKTTQPSAITSSQTIDKEAADARKKEIANKMLGTVAKAVELPFKIVAEEGHRKYLENEYAKQKEPKRYTPLPKTTVKTQNEQEEKSKALKEQRKQERKEARENGK